MKKLSRVVELLYGAPWLMEAQALEFMGAIVENHLAGGPIPVVEPKPVTSGPEAERGVAVIPIHGPVVPRASLMGNMSSRSLSSQDISAMVRAADQDSRIKAIVLDIDSPGGSALGAFETADVIAGVGKDIFASINGMGASLAYLYASQCDRVFASRGSRPGSIGVVCGYSEAAEPNVTRSITVAVPHLKSPVNLTTKEIEAQLLAQAERYFGMFTGAIARKRPAVDMEKAATGEVFFADEALKLGLIDGIQTLDDVVESLLN